MCGAPPAAATSCWPGRFDKSDSDRKVRAGGTVYSIAFHTWTVGLIFKHIVLYIQFKTYKYVCV